MGIGDNDVGYRKDYKYNPKTDIALIDIAGPILKKLSINLQKREEELKEEQKSSNNLVGSTEKEADNKAHHKKQLSNDNHDIYAGKMWNQFVDFVRGNVSDEDMASPTYERKLQTVANILGNWGSSESLRSSKVAPIQYELLNRVINSKPLNETSSESESKKAKLYYDICHITFKPFIEKQTEYAIHKFSNVNSELIMEMSSKMYDHTFAKEDLELTTVTEFKNLIAKSIYNRSVNIAIKIARDERLGKNVNNSSAEVKDVLLDKSWVSPADNMDRKNHGIGHLSEILKEIFPKLSRIQQAVIKYDLDPNKPKENPGKKMLKYEIIAQELGVPESSVRTAYSMLLDRLSHIPEVRNLYKSEFGAEDATRKTKHGNANNSNSNNTSPDPRIQTGEVRGAKSAKIGVTTIK